RPTSPTLFPYTTLFRSDAAGSNAGQGDEAVADHLHLLLPVVPCRSGAVLGRQQRLVDCTAVVHYPEDRARGEASLTPSASAKRPDRKSTRLNSSHVKIS